MKCRQIRPTNRTTRLRVGTRRPARDRARSCAHFTELLSPPVEGLPDVIVVASRTAMQVAAGSALVGGPGSHWLGLCCRTLREVWIVAHPPLRHTSLPDWSGA